jgi:hypothetical protein
VKYLAGTSDSIMDASFGGTRSTETSVWKVCKRHQFHMETSRL